MHDVLSTSEAVLCICWLIHGILSERSCHNGVDQRFREGVGTLLDHLQAILDHCKALAIFSGCALDDAVIDHDLPECGNAGLPHVFRRFQQGLRKGQCIVIFQVSCVCQYPVHQQLLFLLQRWFIQVIKHILIRPGRLQ